MAFVLDDLALFALVATAAGTAVEAKAQSDFQRARRRKTRQGLNKLDEDTRKSERLVREQGLAKLDPANELALVATNDSRNAASLAKVSKQIRPARNSATSGFKGKVSGKFVQGRANAEIADTRRFKKSAINTGRFLSNAQTVVDRGESFHPWESKLERREGSHAGTNG